MPYHPIDVHVGARLAQRRALLGMSQMTMGKVVGLSFQQIQKYERGRDRISASRLYEFAKVLDVPVSYFFEKMAAGAMRLKSKRVVTKAKSKPAKKAAQKEAVVPAVETLVDTTEIREESEPKPPSLI